MYSVQEDLRAKMDQRVQLDVLELRESVVLQEGLDPQENLANKDFQEHQEKWEDLVLKGHLVSEVLLDQRVSREAEVLLGLRVLLASLVLSV